MRIWVTDEVHPLLLEGLRKHGHQVKYDPKIPFESVRGDIGSWEGIIINSKIIMDEEMMERAEHLRFIGRLGSGLDTVDLPEAETRNIAVLRAPEGNRNAVAEHTLGMLLALLNHLCRADRQVRHMRWEREMNRGRELAGSTVGIIGYGNNGTRFTEKLSGMDVDILVYDKYKQGFGTDKIEEVTLAELQGRSDIISLHIPLTDETRQLVDDAFIQKCQSGVIFINISRGEIIRTKSLLEALKTGHIAGACLDVLENEKPETYSRQEKAMYDELFAMENVAMTPHVAGWTVESKKRIAEVLLNKICDLERKHIGD